VRAPGELPELQPKQLHEDWLPMLEEMRDERELPDWIGNGPLPGGWVECQSSAGGFYLLMVESEPLYLVGPFVDHQHAYSWAVDYESKQDDIGWQVVWLDDAGRPAVLRAPG
jgi:hypothetical protein